MLGLFDHWNRPEGESIVLMGSCFSDHLKPFLEREKFQVCSNPFGTLFHPIPIFNWLKWASENAMSAHDMQLVFHEEQWKSLVGGKVLRSDSLVELKEVISSKLNQLHEVLSKAETLVITLGTAHAWIHEEFGLVGNCQRLPQQVFQQKIISLDEMYRAGESCISALLKLNPQLRIVLTVSPVKHWRMGVVENAHTKARCIELSHALCERIGLDYFPSYEFVTDVLRSDEYFESDRCHPNPRAIELVLKEFLKL